MAAGLKRLRRGPAVICSWVIVRLSSVRPWLLTALALAAVITLATGLAARLGVNSKMVRASATVRPRTRLATRLILRGLWRMPLAPARTVVTSAIIFYPSWRGHGICGLG